MSHVSESPFPSASLGQPGEPKSPGHVSHAQDTTPGSSVPYSTSNPLRLGGAPSNIPMSSSSQALYHTDQSTSSNPLTGNPTPSIVQALQEISDSVLPKELQSAMSDQEITDLLSKNDIATSLAEDILAQLTQGHSLDKDPLSDSDLKKDSFDLLSENLLSSSVTLSDTETSKLDLSEEKGARSDTDPSTKLNINMTAKEILHCCKGIGKDFVYNFNLI